MPGIRDRGLGPQMPRNVNISEIIKKCPLK